MAGWEPDTGARVREQYTLSPGRLLVQGASTKRGKPQFVDVQLFGPGGQHLAPIEVKRQKFGVAAGLQQALDYKDRLGVPFAFSTNGEGFIFHDLTGGDKLETKLGMDEFPSPGELWLKYLQWKGITSEASKVLDEQFYTHVEKEPRYYQRDAVNRVMELVAKGQNRGLLVMATGTGKTFTASHIIHKFRATHPDPNARVLFLVDRNALADQTIAKDFSIFNEELVKVGDRLFQTSKEVFVGLYQAMTGDDEEKNIYADLPPDFFDLIIVDECHRSSRKVDGSWRKVLDHFQSAVQIGLTATPKDENDGSNLAYYGDPIYTYTLQQGIEDGYLAPYRVTRITIDKDVYGIVIPPGALDDNGIPVADREYNQRDFDKDLIIKQRRQIVAEELTNHLKATDRFAKTILFCESTDHAREMRRLLVNLNADLARSHSNYVSVITGDEYDREERLGEFMDPEATTPVIACTAKLLSTGVDVETCKNIVIDQNIESMSEFKQIVGRGTRVYEKFNDDSKNKRFFTILDFRNATRLFFDPEFDGEPEAVEEKKRSEAGTKTTSKSEKKYVPVVSDPTTQVVQKHKRFLDSKGQLITDELIDYTRVQLRGKYASLDEFLNAWTSADKKQAIIEELDCEGIFWDDLRDAIPNGRDLDIFDLVCHVAFDRPALTRKERRDGILKGGYFDKFGPTAIRVLQNILDKYADQGVLAIESPELLRLPEFEDQFGRPLQIANEFGGPKEYGDALSKLIDDLYQVHA